MCDTTQGSMCLKSHENTLMYVDTVTFFKILNQRLLTPRWPLTPILLRSHVWFYPKDHCVQVSRKYIKVCGYSDPFSKTFINQRSLTPRWPLTSCLLGSHVWLYPRINVSKSHGNTSMYVDRVINLSILQNTTYILHTCTYTDGTYYVQIEWLQSLWKFLWKAFH